MALIECKKCGKQISDQAKFCVHCGEPVQSGTKLCPACKTANPPDARFCSNCGYNFQGDSELNRGPKTSKRIKRNGAPKWPIAVISIALFAIIAFLTYGILFRQSEKSTSLSDISPAKTEEPSDNKKSVMITVPETPDISSQTASDSIIDPETGCFIADLRQLSLWIDLRLSLLDTGLGSAVTESNAQKIGESKYIIAIGEVDDGVISQKRAGIVYGVNSKGERADGFEKQDIERLHAVIYSTNPVHVMGIPLSIISVCEKTIVNDQVREGILNCYNSVVIENKDSYEYKANGMCYVMSRNEIGRINFDVFADKSASSFNGNSIMPSSTDSSAQQSINNLDNQNTSLSAASAGSIVTFGRYEQDRNSENGKEPIEWLVLSNDSDYLMLLSSKVLDEKAYSALKGTPWEESDIRNWLNSDFYNTAFNDSEKAMIVATNLPEEGVSDYVFLLSKDEAYYYFPDIETRKAEWTPFARTGMSSEPFAWLLRTSAEDSTAASVVFNNTGKINETAGIYNITSKLGVRPAFYLRLSD